jgi:hypothetical protein
MMLRFPAAALVVIASTILLGVVVSAQHQDSSFYPHGHFDRVTKLTDPDALNAFVESNLAQSKSVFVRWIASEG